ncbi:pro-neuregulin-3, membrane-bound isoform [Thalassophryne amazonica]|uniref:pro-neuregulin-3, membrane-bound isoform n=1 Tax=Thalassophryne amazonica TaxID=390379 RepID=UPI001470FBC4|nr:pro-neuregulin-3, membrane-bound isoform [Thalassophryne amazonica]
MSHNGQKGKMSECSGPAVSGAVILEEPEGSGATGRGEGQAQDQGPLRWGGCTLWPRQQTWLCVVPLLIGFIGLGLSLMLLKWIVVGTVRDYVPTDLVDANRIGQDPIFLSKPSGIPKGPDTTTTTTTTTTAITVDGGNHTPRTVTVAKGRTRSTTTTTTNPRGGGASGSQVTPGHRNGRGHSGITTTTAVLWTTPIIGAATLSPSPSNPTVLHDSTQMWTPEQTTTETVSMMLTTRSHAHRKTPSPTVPPLHSEHFKPCHEKDLAYCLNGGECFVIETLSGPHKHCKCREGYQGIRCDQFLPKTDTILSDPNHLGIEFMESKEVYKTQVLSITSIAMAISLLGTLCVALYCRNKRRREKLQAHLKESRSLKNYTANSQNSLNSNSRNLNINLQMHEDCKHSSQSRHGNICESSLAGCCITATASSNSRVTVKHQRSGSLTHSPDQRAWAAHWSTPRRTPPISKGRLNPIGGSKYSGPAYQHLQEADSSEKEAETQRGCQMGENPCDDSKREAFLHMQTPVSMETSPTPWNRHAEGCSGPCAPSEHHPLDPVTRSLRRPDRRHSHSPTPPFRSCSIPIIPSVQCHHDDEVSCMQTSVSPVAAACRGAPCTQAGRPKAKAMEITSSFSSSSTICAKQDEVAMLLEEAQEHLRALALAHRTQEDDGIISGRLAVVPMEARETVCFLSPGGGGSRALSRSAPTQTQLLSPKTSHRDLCQTDQ